MRHSQHREAKPVPASRRERLLFAGITAQAPPPPWKETRGEAPAQSRAAPSGPGLVWLFSPEGLWLLHSKARRRPQGTDPPQDGAQSYRLGSSGTIELFVPDWVHPDLEMDLTGSLPGSPKYPECPPRECTALLPVPLRHGIQGLGSDPGPPDTPLLSKALCRLVSWGLSLR